VTLIYNHHSRLLPAKLTDVQHMYHELIISTTHVHFRSQHLPRGDRCEGRVGENTEVGRCVDRNQGCSTWPTCHELAHDLSLTNGLADFLTVGRIWIVGSALSRGAKMDSSVVNRFADPIQNFLMMFDTR